MTNPVPGPPVQPKPTPSASNFAFVAASWPEIAEEARRAEHYVNGDARSSVFYARRTAELVVHWLYRVDSALHPPYKDDLSSLLFEPTFKHLVGQGIHQKLDLIRKQGNAAVHRTTPVRATDSLAVVRELFYVLVWLAHRYAPTDAGKPTPGAVFNAATLPTSQPGLVAKTMAQLQKAADDLAVKDAALAQAAVDNADLAAQLKALQEQVAATKAANAVVPDTTDYREAETRDLFIDILLKEAGWLLAEKRDREFPVAGIPGASGNGYVDYVLWGDDGLPLGIVEAKRTTKDARAGKHQAVLYADALEQSNGQRPVIFYTNGYEHWIWDDAPWGDANGYPPRRVDGFYTREQLALLVQRRAARHPLATVAVDTSIAGRYYQERAIRTIAESFETKRERKALLVMATGSGKTRTVIALADLLMRANWAKRILFLADRVALVNQAANAFKEHLPDSAPVNLVTDKDTEGRVFVSTYPTMMGLIDQGADELRRFGPGYFDLIVIDEAHRSVYQKYGEIFAYFDSLLVGLTATPKDEVDHNTYGLFNLEDGVPTDSYDLADAIADGYLVPPAARPIALGFMKRGIRYDDLSNDEKEAWDLLEWDDGLIPDEVDAAALNKWLFNADTVDKVLEVLMTEGRTVAGGDRLGKTIVFAKNNAHAEFILERFDANYPEHAGKFASVITYKAGSAPVVQSLIDAFSLPASSPHIAISVDMLDTGIDVPDVVNLVFFKPVHSKTKYWQMVGRGTRLRPDLYGPDAPKADFMIFDVCGNIEYFNTGMPTAEGSTPVPLSQRLFRARLDLIGLIDDSPAVTDAERGLRTSLASGLHGVVASMSLDNFLVRRHRRGVERFADASRWASLSAHDREELARDLSGLPSAASAAETDELAKRFDLLALRAQLAVVAGDASLAAARDRIRAIADALGDQRTIPAIAQHLELIDAVAGESWWDGVTLPMLELMRIRLRGLVRLIDSVPQTIVYTDFEDTLDEHVPGGAIIYGTPGVDKQRFRDKMLAFLRAHSDDMVMSKLRLGRQLTALDLEQLQQILIDSGDFSADELAAKVEEAHGLGLLIRSIIGLDRSAATDALSAFVGDASFTANQIAFVDLVVEHLTARGTVSLGILYESPFTNYAPSGPDGIFTTAQVQQLFGVLKAVEATAVASAS